MIIDIWIETIAMNEAAFFGWAQHTCSISTMYIARAGKLCVSFEILKPKKERNHEGTTECIRRNVADV